MGRPNGISKGVSFDGQRRKFRVQVWDPTEYHLVHGGYFDTQDDAVARFDELTAQLAPPRPRRSSSALNDS
jgi:hypothetical protein